MSNFKVGDRVKIVSNPGRWAHCLSVGSCARVSKVDNTDNSLEVIGDLTGHSLAQWVGFEDVVKLESRKIVITTDGETTTARMFSGKDLVKSAEAKCSPRDTFVFETGVALAMDKLLDQEKKAEPEAPKFDKEDLKDGMFIRVSDGSWGVIVGDLVVCDDGMFLRVSELHEDLTWDLAGTVEVVLEGVTSFNGAKCTPRDSGCVKYIRPGV